MQVSINDLKYVPTVFLRTAEMQALEQLSNAEKDSIIPLIPIKPWANSNHLVNSLRRVERALPNRRFFIDIDRYYLRASERPAWSEFQALRSSTDNFLNWRNFADESEFAIPCIQIFGSQADVIGAQIAWADQNNKPFALRIEQRFPCDRAAVLAAFGSIEHSNYIIVLDAGWSRDVLSSQLWASGWITALNNLHNDAKIVVSASSFPDQFMPYGQFGTENLQERPFYNALRGTHNTARLIYGDWASSRPHGNDSGGPGYSRVDLPVANSWVFFRSDAIGGDFQPLAAQARNSAYWDGDLNNWGKYFIDNTASGTGFTINSAQQAAAARINIHLNQQISQGLGVAIGDVPEDYED
ncbi:beta family protein [Devosia chinhatensis]|uniref:beta family protein n=1 Tax=Devosia chinhatensis TaxID=429727 RepID=UPI000A050D60|nr:hypothetical protein [Devosia chinhatensis]